MSERRRVAVARRAGALIAAGTPVICPIAHNVAILRELNVGTGWDTWKQQDIALLSACDQLLVLRLDGWDTSRGVSAEIALAKQLGMPVLFLDP